MEINSISTLISNVRTSPGSTHGDYIYDLAGFESHGIARTVDTRPFVHQIPQKMFKQTIGSNL